jgi:hypothetical protein
MILTSEGRSTYLEMYIQQECKQPITLYTYTSRPAILANY